MAFPATPLDVEVSIALSADLTDPGSWAWTDITSYVRENRKIRVRRGRSSERSTMPPSRCTLTVDNSDGRFCRLLPTGAWYGQIDKNTPLRVRVNNGSGYITRFIGYVSGWPPSWDPSEADQTVTLTADGILRRLGQGRVLRPALERAILAMSPAAYWALQDEDGSTNAASALPSGVPLAVNNLVTFQSSLSPAGSSGAVDLSAGGFMVARTGISAGAVASWEFECNFGWDTLPTLTAAADLLVGLKTPGSAVVEWGIGVLELSSVPRFGIYRLDSAGTLSVGSSGTTAIEPGRTYHFRIKMTQNGADVDFERWLDGVANGSGTQTATTLSAPTLITFNPRQSTTQMPHSVSHAAVWVPTRAVADTYLAADGYVGEMAHERVHRLCTEEGILVTVNATSSQAMGAQGTDTVVGEMNRCATADFGLLYEPFNVGLAYLSSTERTNQASVMTLQYDQGHISPPWDPSDDDRDLRNDVTASRPGGSSARVTDEDSIDAVGVYDDTISANTETDEQLPHVAGWAVHLGTVDELRWPAVRPNLLGHPTLIDDWMAADLGQQLHVTGHPSPLAPDDIAQIIEGYEETFGSYEYSVTANLSPASGWTVAELDSDTLGKLDTDGTELVSGVTSSATSLRVLTTTPSSPLWTTDAGEMPVPLVVAGEVMSATAIASLVVDPFTRSTSNSWGSTPEGFAYTHDGTASAFNTTGTTATHTHTATNTGRLSRIDIGCPDSRIRAVHSVPALASGVALVAYNVARFADANNYYMARIGWTTGATITLTLRKRVAGVETNLLSVTIPALTHVAATRYVVDFECIGSSLSAKLWPESGTEPRSWQANATDTDLASGNWVGLRSVLDTGSTNVTPFLFTFDAFTVLNPQTMTVTRSVNSVAKAQSTGAAVNVHQPARLAL